MGKLEKIKIMLQSMIATFNQISTDKGILSYDGDEIEVGIGVTVVDEDGNTKPAEDGEYYLGEGDKRTIVVENGVIKEIIEPEETNESETEETNVELSKFNKVKVAFEESYEEKIRKIADAIYAAGYNGYVIEAGDEYAVVEVWDETDMSDKFYRFELSWDEEGNVIVGKRQEVKPAFVPVQEDVEKVSEEVKEEFAEESEVAEAIVDEIKEVAEDAVDEAEAENTEDAAQKIADLEQLVEELKAKIKELENAPATESVSEEFKMQNRVEKTGVAKLDKLAGKLGIN